MTTYYRPRTIEPQWTVLQRQVHNYLVWGVNASVALIPIGDAILAVTKGQTPNGTVAACALGAITVINLAAHAYATSGVKFGK